MGIYDARFHTSEVLYNYPPNTEIILFRVTQELLNNIVKHAEATAIEISLDYQYDQFTIYISDNGKGFVQSTTPDQRSGLGLKNIDSRVAMIGGKINVTSEPGKGTKAVIQIPAPENIPHSRSEIAQKEEPGVLNKYP